MNTQCKQFREKFEDYILGTLSPEEKKKLEAHLASCGDCQREFAKEKKLIGLFQSMERKPAPQVLRQRVLDFAQKQREKGDWKGRLSAILTWPRLRMLTGAATLALLVFWCVQIVRAPRPLEKTTVKVSQETRFMALKIEAPMEKSAELKSKASSTEIMDKNEEITQGSPVLASPAPEISQKGVFNEEMAEGVVLAPSRSPTSVMGGKLVPEERLDDKTDRDMDETVMNLKRRTGEADYLDITESIKAFGASQISHLEKLDSAPNRYAFAISYSEYERFKKEIENTNIRIVNVKPFPVVAGSLSEAKKEATHQLRQTQQDDSFYSQQQKPLYSSRAAQPATESIAPKSAGKKGVMMEREEMESQLQYILKDAPALPSVAASPSPSGSIVTNGFQAQAPQKQKERKALIEQEPSQYIDVLKRDVVKRKPGDTATFSGVDSREKGQFMDDSSSPTIIQTQDRMRLNRLTNWESLVYVEIEVEPDK